MHVAVVTETFPPEVNGVALTLGRLVSGLRARGHTVSVVHPRRPGLDRTASDAADTMLVTGVPAPGYPGVWPAPACARAGAASAPTSRTWRPRDRSAGRPWPPPAGWACRS
jgi:hypothetical protein